MRSTLKTLILAPVLVIAAGCSKDKPADPALNNDLSLAAQANPNARLDSVTAAERMNAASAPAANNLRTSATPAAPAPARRTTSSTHRSSSSGTSSGTSSGSTVASQPREVTTKHTKRDAAIGAAAGAIVGAASSRDKVKGGIIGAAAGGILGGVIGNNADIQKKRVP